MSNPYLQRLQALKTERGARDELTKLTNPRTEVVADAASTEGLRIVSFVSTQSRGFSKSEGSGADQGDLAATAENVTRANRQNCQNPPYWRTLTVLEAVCWTSRDLFGLHMPPARPHPSYHRLSRYDETGLIWLLQGRQVVGLTASTAAILNPSGSITCYRRHSKPAIGPLGDSLDDFQ